MPLGLALVAGGLATINPCGFSLLPALLSFYVATDERRLPPAPTAVLQGLYVGAVVTAGFIAVFAAVGIPIVLGATQITRAIPWAGAIIGAGLVLVGLLVLRGKHLSIGVRTRLQAGRRRGPRTMFAFGVAYGTASLGCTLPVFLAVVGVSLSTRGSGAALLVLVAYATGMALVVTALAIGAALAREGLARRLRRVLPHMDRIAGGLLVLAGGYLTYFWSRVLLLPPGRLNDDPVVGFVARFTASIERAAGSGFVLWVVLVAGLVVITAVVTSLLQRRRRKRGPTTEQFEGGSPTAHPGCRST